MNRCLQRNDRRCSRDNRTPAPASAAAGQYQREREKNGECLLSETIFISHVVCSYYESMNFQALYTYIRPYRSKPGVVHAGRRLTGYADRTPETSSQTSCARRGRTSRPASSTRLRMNPSPPASRYGQPAAGDPLRDGLFREKRSMIRQTPAGMRGSYHSSAFGLITRCGRKVSNGTGNNASFPIISMDNGISSLMKTALCLCGRNVSFSL